LLPLLLLMPLLSCCEAAVLPSQSNKETWFDGLKDMVGL
jgi:hypothetical protein